MKKHAINAALLIEIVTTLDRDVAGVVLTDWAREITGKEYFGVDTRKTTVNDLQAKARADARAQRKAAADKSAKAKQSAGARWNKAQPTPQNTLTHADWITNTVNQLIKAAPFLTNHAESLLRWLAVVDEKFGEQPYLSIENNLRAAVGYAGQNPDIFEAMINNSINGCWKQLYPIKNNNYGRSKDNNTGAPAVDVSAIAAGMQRANNDKKQ